MSPLLQDKATKALNWLTPRSSGLQNRCTFLIHIQLNGYATGFIEPGDLSFVEFHAEHHLDQLTSPFPRVAPCLNRQVPELPHNGHTTLVYDSLTPAPMPNFVDAQCLTMASGTLPSFHVGPISSPTISTLSISTIAPCNTHLHDSGATRKGPPRK
jgi:hypothetical protein